MPTNIPEHDIHEVTVTSQDDALQGDTITIRYYRDSPDQSPIDGDTATGALSGSDMSFATDLEAQGIGPGTWYWQLVRDDSGTERGVEINGEPRNEREIRVTDSPGI